MDIAEAAAIYSAFLGGDSLTGWIARVERDLPAGKIEIPPGMADAFTAALTLKRSVGQINTIIHAVGMLATLPRILEPGEQLLSLSIGAGNTGKDVDLETDRRVAEFKFIDWKGADSLRQDAVFADLVKLCMLQTDKEKCLYLSGSTLALKFFRGRRAISSVLGRKPDLLQQFTEAYGAGHIVVADFFACAHNTVHVVDLQAEFPDLFRMA